MIKSTELNPHYVIAKEIWVTILTRNVDPQPPSATIFVEETLGFGLSNQESHKAPIGKEATRSRGRHQPKKWPSHYFTHLWIIVHASGVLHLISLSFNFNFSLRCSWNDNFNYTGYRLDDYFFYFQFWKISTLICRSVVYNSKTFLCWFIFFLSLKSIMN